MGSYGARLLQARLVFRGRVQGVGFRETVRLHADSCGLSGWVRNEHDGTVSAVLEGPPEAIQELVSRIHASFGDGLEGIQRQDGLPEHELEGFRILRD
ncbi:MAG: acylphosphatase [Planctomycetota bacterium]|nr:acylphosphatase [Planctomycetota bacterium]